MLFRSLKVKYNIHLITKEIRKTNCIIICSRPTGDFHTIPRSSYYKWLTREGSVLESENKILMKEIIKIYNKVNEIYGYRRITMNLNRELENKRKLLLFIELYVRAKIIKQ